MAKSVTRLVELGLVESQRGRTGGLFITEAGRSITVGRLVRDLEGDREVVACTGIPPCPLVGACRLRRVLADARDAFYRELDRHTFVELVSGPAIGLLHMLAGPSGSDIEERGIPVHTEIVTTEPALEPEYAETIRATLPLVAANIDRITQVFYRTMFGNHPELIRDLFNRGNQAQGAQSRALAASIATFATHLVDPQQARPNTMLSRIANKHASLGVIADQYQVVHDNLFAAIVEVLGADVVDASVAAAWDRVYWLMADALIDEEKGLYVAAGVEPGDVYRRATVVAREDEPSGVAIFTVESADPATPLPDFAPGQYVSVGVRLPDGARQLRQYSLVDAPDAGRLSFAVKRIDAAGGCPAGEVSTWLHERVRPGDVVDVTVPFGDAGVDLADDAPLVLVSGGIGATPMIGILEQLVARHPVRRTLVVHGDRSPDTHPLRNRLRQLMSRLPESELELWYQDAVPGAHTGLVDLTELELPADADIHVCGPVGFLHEMRAQLHALGVPDTRIHTEQFTPTDWRLDGCPR
ncbi:hemin transporter [Nocardia arthritidis]|uniref:nitric oxide dioxygenase n=2 Tax=Nocardia arthritidis TaxID=228602 RepID=A0A6G9YKV9_9NOCA|nr:hemin transporter [Nocardia arthritidis]